MIKIVNRINCSTVAVKLIHIVRIFIGGPIHGAEHYCIIIDEMAAISQLDNPVSESKVVAGGPQLFVLAFT